MSRIDKLTPIQKGTVLNPTGRPKGTKNKSKIASDVIELSFHSVFKKHPNYKELIATFPNILDQASIEEVIYLIQCHKAIFKEDTNAATFIINRARGAKPEATNGSNEVLPILTPEETQTIAENLRKLI